MLGTPSIRRYYLFFGRKVAYSAGFMPKKAVTMRPVRTISRKDRCSNPTLEQRNPQRPYAGHGLGSVKIWSDPHGDMGSQAEQKRPGRRTLSPEVTEVSVPILRGRRRLEESCP